MENGSHVTEGGNHSRWEWMTAFRKWFVAVGIGVVVGAGFGAWSVRDQWWHWFFPPKLQFIVKPPDTPYSENSLIKFTLTDEFDEPLTGEYKCKFFMNNVPAGPSAGCAKENAVAVPEKVINDSGDQDKVEIRLYVIAKNEAGRDVLWTTARVVVLRERQLVIEPANPKVGAPGTVELRARIGDTLASERIGNRVCQWDTKQLPDFIVLVGAQGKCTRILRITEDAPLEGFYDVGVSVRDPSNDRQGPFVKEGTATIHVYNRDVQIDTSTNSFQLGESYWIRARAGGTALRPEDGAICRWSVEGNDYFNKILSNQAACQFKLMVDEKIFSEPIEIESDAKIRLVVELPNEDKKPLVIGPVYKRVELLGLPPLILETGDGAKTYFPGDEVHLKAGFDHQPQVLPDGWECRFNWHGEDKHDAVSSRQADGVICETAFDIPGKWITAGEETATKQATVELISPVGEAVLEASLDITFALLNGHWQVFALDESASMARPLIGSGWPLVVHRWPPNRETAMDVALEVIRTEAPKLDAQLATTALFAFGGGRPDMKRSGCGRFKWRQDPIRSNIENRMAAAISEIHVRPGDSELADAGEAIKRIVRRYTAEIEKLKQRPANGKFHLNLILLSRMPTTCTGNPSLSELNDDIRKGLEYIGASFELRPTLTGLVFIYLDLAEPKSFWDSPFYRALREIEEPEVVFYPIIDRTQNDEIKLLLAALSSLSGAEGKNACGGLVKGLRQLELSAMADRLQETCQ